MGIILWLVIGGVVGWLASIVIGALIGGWLIGPLVGAPSINSGELSIASLLVSFLGAVILLAIVNLITRSRVR
jgi:uncharacterized membrane protein YeaQ/YmgE (transglycosylase-associated protein family)